MRLVWDQSDVMGTWAAARIPIMHGRGFGENTRSVGFVNDDNRTVGVIVFTEWQPEYQTMMVHAASADPSWVKARACWRELFHYAFVTCNVNKLWTEAPLSYRRSLRFQKAFGWTPEAVLADRYGPGEPSVVSHIYRADYEAGKLYIKPARESVS